MKLKCIKQIQLEMAIAEAVRFVDKANEAIRALEAKTYAQYQSKDVAAAKRASMDLTRQLVFVRK